MAIGRDRSDIGVFEEGLASARREYLRGDQGDYEQRQAREVVSNILINTAQENGLYIEPGNLKDLGLKAAKKTSESEIYILL